MRLHEYEGADIFESAGIRVPGRGVARTAPEAVAIAEKIGYPVVLKAQVLVGGRGLAGGVKTAVNSSEMKALSEKMLESEIKGLPVEMILVTEKMNIVDELYAAVTVDGYSGRPVVVASTEGGVHIEEVAGKTPDRIVSVRVDPRFGFYPYQARSLLGKLGLKNRLLVSFADVLVRLYKVFSQLEGMIVEINPLAVLEDGKLCAVDAVLEVAEEGDTYVSRGGVKLAGALEALALKVGGLVAMDVGASTGGFTDCLLRRGAKTVYAVDVGYGQLAWKLRQDSRVVVLERINIRYLTHEQVPELVDLAVIDISFISLKKVIPKVFEFLKSGGRLLALIKPQFEVGRSQVGKGGVVRDPELHTQVVDDLKDYFQDQGLEVEGMVESSLLGPKGNREFFLLGVKSRL